MCSFSRKWKWKSQSQPDSANPMNYTVYGILPPRILEWEAFPLLQGIFPTPGLNPGLPHCRWIFNQLSHKGSPRILVWVAYPFSSGSSQPRNLTGVSCITSRFFTNWVIREAFIEIYTNEKLRGIKKVYKESSICVGS